MGLCSSYRAAVCLNVVSVVTLQTVDSKKNFSERQSEENNIHKLVFKCRFFMSETVIADKRVHLLRPKIDVSLSILIHHGIL